MKALLSDQPGGPETLRIAELPDPVAGTGELLVRVWACAINYPDALIIEDKYQLKPPRPFAPGGEIAGEVEAVGEGVEGWAIGDRLIAVPGFGGKAATLHSRMVSFGASFRSSCSLSLIALDRTLSAFLLPQTRVARISIG